MKRNIYTIVSGIFFFLLLAKGSISVADDVTPPANDNFSNALEIYGVSGAIAGTNVGSTSEPGESSECGDFFCWGYSVWYRWVAPDEPLPQMFSIDSNFDAILTIYTGTNLTDLSLVEDPVGGSNGYFLGEPEAGRTYFIRVDSIVGIHSIDYGIFTLNWQEYGFVRGIVYDNTGTHLTDGWVSVSPGSDACQPHSGAGSTSAEINIDGSYRLAGIGEGEYIISAMGQVYAGGISHVQEYWNQNGGSPYCELAESLTVTAGEEVSGIDFYLDPEATIAGQTESISGSQIETNVQAFRGNNACSDVQEHGIGIASGGQYHIGGLAAGEYYLYADAYGNYISKWWTQSGGTTDCALAQTIRIGTGESITDIDFQLERGTIISGEVVAESGTPPLSEVFNRRGFPIVIWIESFRGTNACNATKVGEDGSAVGGGSYQIEGLAAGEYYLKLTTDVNRYPSEWWAPSASVYSCRDAKPVRITTQQGAVNDIDFQIAPRVNTVPALFLLRSLP